MKILYIHQYFTTPLEPGGTRSYWIAQELIKRGHEVTMITSSKKIAGKREERIIDGIRVIYLKGSYDQSMGIWARLGAFLWFVVQACVISFKQKDIRLVIATSTPLTVGIPPLLLKWFKRIPYVFEVRDLWPEVPIQMGALKNPLIIRAARFFEKTIYRHAAHVVALSPGMQEGVTRYILREKTSMIPNMSKKDEFWPREKNRDLEKKLGLHPTSFKVVHFGSLGLANNTETIIESAKLLKDDATVEFVFLGGGARERNLKKEAERYGLNNVRFLGQFPMRETSEIVNLCDVSVVSFKDLPVLYTNSPNKLFDSLSAGKPVIVNSAGWTKDLVERFRCGCYVNPHDPAELATCVKNMQANPQTVLKMGVLARSLAENKFDKSILCRKFVDIIEQQHV